MCPTGCFDSTKSQEDGKCDVTQEHEENPKSNPAKTGKEEKKKEKKKKKRTNSIVPRMTWVITRRVP